MHNKLESLMGKAGGFIHDNPIKVILMVLLLLTFPLSHLPLIKVDTSTAPAGPFGHLAVFNSDTLK